MVDSLSIVGHRSAMITSTLLNLMIIILLRAYSSWREWRHTLPCRGRHASPTTTGTAGWSEGISAMADQMTSSSSQIYLCREVIAPCQPSDMIQFIEADELGRLPLDATRSSLMLDILYIVVGTISWQRAYCRECLVSTCHTRRSIRRSSTAVGRQKCPCPPLHCHPIDTSI